ncbi:unnamed protein product [Blepharisma stoltei]|uniref:Uncharacterized protein n=1 Tax=Blepharisma stoltei TaxID=1481888 RepID=A0AAU9JER5_9CILI|nr:unnamed protein product [Blepharisma stoltei]
MIMVYGDPDQIFIEKWWLLFSKKIKSKFQRNFLILLQNYDSHLVILNLKSKKFFPFFLVFFSENCICPL